MKLATIDDIGFTRYYFPGEAHGGDECGFV